jgi:hypothetical protein
MVIDVATVVIVATLSGKQSGKLCHPPPKFAPFTMMKDGILPLGTWYTTVVYEGGILGPLSTAVRPASCTMVQTVIYHGGVLQYSLVDVLHPHMGQSGILLVYCLHACPCDWLSANQAVVSVACFSGQCRSALPLQTSRTHLLNRDAKDINEVMSIGYMQQPALLRFSMPTVLQQRPEQAMLRLPLQGLMCTQLFCTGRRVVVGTCQRLTSYVALGCGASTIYCMFGSFNFAWNHPEDCHQVT